MDNIAYLNKDTSCGRAIILDADSGVFFDLDGTLVDTAPDFQAVINSLCQDNHILPPTTAAIHATVSSGARALISLAFHIDPGHERFAALLQDLLDRYEQQLHNTQASLYPNMDRLLRLLEERTIPWGVVTNKPERFSAPLMAALQLQQRCGVLICPDHVTHTKPHPEPLLLACQLTARQPQRSVYIGDHPRDIDAGNAAGMTTIAAAFGYLPDAPAITTWGAHRVADSANDIIEYFWPVANAGHNN